jgi:putative pyruvate formate lyase activating enzyme
MRKMTRRQFFPAAFEKAAAAAVVARFLPGEGIPMSAEQNKAFEASYIPLHKSGEIARRAERLRAIYENCTLCPRDCRVDRTRGQTGKCRSSDNVKVSSAFAHFGEEPPLVGQGGSGTIFFSNCGLRCVYCQNYQISWESQGQEISDRTLAEMMVKVQGMGCHNINLVTPTHYVPSIVRAVELAVPSGLRIPLVYNTSGYEKLETLELLDGIVDIYLPDFKYSDPAMAAKYSSEAYQYPYYAKIGLREMFRQVGDLTVDGKGVARRGLIVRHLVLPNRIAGTEEVLKFIAENLSRTTYVNIMRQYRPEYKAPEFPEINRLIKTAEYTEALGWARKYGLTRLGH